MHRRAIIATIGNVLGSLLKNTVVDSDIARALDALPESIELNELGYDPWGFNLEAAKVYYTLARQIYRYFRPEIHGIENLPAGRVLIVPNHSGQLPFDGLVLAVACLLEAKPPRLVRGMVERFVPALPLINIAFSRSGVVLGDPINCRNLLEAENAILVFPEGARGISKPWSERYQLQSFGRGFMRLALQTKAPIVPVAVVGAEESIISLGSAKPIAKLLRSPAFPTPALLPLLGPLAFLPMPTKFHVYFGKPMVFDGPFDDEDEVIEGKVAEVTETINDLIAHGRAQRTSWF